MKISILTPTYNRAYILKNLYNSLIINSKTNNNFEWLIMDDGSTDNTESLINSWIDENKIDIKYYKKENQGKMSALNDLLQYITGDIVLEVDSDDYITDNALEIIRKDYELLDKSKNVYGIIYPRKLIGSSKKIPNEYKDKIYSLFDIHFKLDLDFDMSITFYADIRKKYKHELENGEKFVTEARMYHKMDKNYSGLLIKTDEIIVCEYQNDGYTKNIVKTFINSPYGYYSYFRELLSFNMNGVILKKRLYILKHYILFSCLTNKSKKKCIEGAKGLNKLIVFLLVIPGYIKTRKMLKNLDKKLK